MRYANSQNENAAISKKRMMQKIRSYDFAIYETVLFLDTHPKNQKALKYYTKLRNERNVLIAEYEKAFGPITTSGNMNEMCWDWIKGPWPWEGDC